jgi:O-acetyl-ADP-ribose deacetylase (regulator of RNase III)
VKGGLGEGVKADSTKLKLCTENILAEVEQENKGIIRKFSGNYLDSVLFPMIGAGDGGLQTRTVAEEIIPAAINYFKSTPNPTIREIYFLAFRLREKNACDKVLDAYCEQGVLKRLA